jgi:Ser/Thr protein kinase RdoA (MazF antagonist)
MPALHEQPWEQRRSVFGDPFPLIDEIRRLDHLLDRPTLDPAVVARAPELRQRLRSSLPTQVRIGCVHGDFQWSNLLFNESKRQATGARRRTVSLRCRHTQGRF